jgi:hypothetical protein
VQGPTSLKRPSGHHRAKEKSDCNSKALPSVLAYLAIQLKVICRIWRKIDTQGYPAAEIPPVFYQRVSPF